MRSCLDQSVHSPARAIHVRPVGVCNRIFAGVHYYLCRTAARTSLARRLLAAASYSCLACMSDSIPNPACCRRARPAAHAVPRRRIARLGGLAMTTTAARRSADLAAVSTLAALRALSLASLRTVIMNRRRVECFSRSTGAPVRSCARYPRRDRRADEKGRPQATTTGTGLRFSSSGSEHASFR